MTDDRRPMNPPPFPPGCRALGVPLHVTSLHAPYGIGDVGPAALKWIDVPHEAPDLLTDPNRSIFLRR